ncbi:variable surface protein [Plasmodium gonderi]|uniref:Variable surface protein n=1 Tax=Plasmodium gonderi TaxID=77519 RepID=A0A1Y1JRV6_PLAGO|nr:variable surface protein [Plasmodium gonderi]GAW84188.1 variable surface protein [Plasmodium gonderi]
MNNIKVALLIFYVYICILRNAVRFSSIFKNIFSYSYSMQTKKYTYNNFIDGIIVYFLYSLYHAYLKEKPNNNIIAKKLCDALINLNNDEVDGICEGYKNINITQDILRKMKELYGMNTIINEINSDGSEDETCECPNKFVILYKGYKDECDPVVMSIFFRRNVPCLYSGIYRKRNIYNNVNEEWIY